MDELKGESEVVHEPPYLHNSDNMGLMRNLIRRELGSNCGRELRESIAESKFVDCEDMVATPCKCSSGSTRSAFLTVFSSDSTHMASTHGDHNLYDGVCVKTLKGHPRTPWSAAFHPGIPGILASGCLGGHVRVWDYRQGGSEFWDVNCVITSVTFHPNERILLIATLNKLYLWDWLQATPFTSLSTQNDKEKIIFVKFDSLGHHFITGITNLKNSNLESGNPFRGYSTASNDNSALTEIEEASWYYRLMMPHHENETRRRIMRPGFYSQMRRRLSASQTLSDLAAAASSHTSHREDEREEPSRERLTNMRTSTPRRSRYSRYPPDHAYIRSSDPETLNLQRRGSSPFTHSPESSFVEVPGSSGDTNNSRSSAFMEVVYSNPDRSSRFQQYRSRRLRERLTRRQSIYSRMDDIRSSRDSHLNPSTSSDRSNFGYRRIDEWAVNRPSSSNETGDATAPTDTSDNALNLSIRSQVDLSVLGRHIEHMQRICQTSLRYLSVSRQRRQILRLQAIRMMLEDLQNQIRNLRESTLERPDSLTNQSTSNNALAMSITRRLHITREGLNRAMRRLNRSTNYTLTSRRTNPSRSSSVPPSYSTQARAMEMSPDLSHSGYNNSVNELIAEESLAVLERTESTTNGENSSRNALRAMSQRLERLIRDNREASNNVNNFDNLIPEDTSPEAVPRSSNDNQSPQEEQANNNDDPTISLSSEGQQRNWSHLLDHGGYARQPRETSSDSEGDAEILQQRGVGRRRWRLFQEEQNSEEVNDEESLELLNWMPSPERLDSRAEYRRDWERARQRLSRARMIFHQRREREMGESSSGGASKSERELNVDQQRQPLRQLQQSQQQRPLHREILSWMVDQLTIDQQGNSGRAEAGEPGLPPGAVLPPPVPESIYRRRRASFYFRNHESGEAGPHNGFPNVRDNYFQQLRNHNFSATHRLQIWDFNSKSTNLPDIGDRTKNIIVEKAKIYNDASVDISSDGNILVTFCSSSLPMTPIFGVYSRFCFSFTYKSSSFGWSFYKVGEDGCRSFR
ncbi:Activating molecule in BECN1-regulated autophagy protein 1 [Lepeophtheirus salmonis]|uniref:Activating molecule in BECN1-regulated autophagy protein 1 n=1 Tax=Lepeophtheirus salmonis TaxID=72036 RepID=A0A7R8D1J8_LEPSM|nr:Activating molecule in BECN1-regulated autophagy protein 1 [Lepeophtheirus salmonis]CAF2996296.1 Activating molecule in BECN1-regulated autophagy protein 1 [Lepeophtheirus salmonis]